MFMALSVGVCCIFFFKQKTAYEMHISDWSSDVCSSDLTMLARIVQMVAEAQRSRAPIQRLADLVSGWFVPAVIVIAILAFVVWAIWGPEPADRKSVV